MKRVVLPVILVLNSLITYAQSKAERQVAAAVEVFRLGLINANKTRLEEILDDRLIYVHSNADAQSKVQFIEELFRTDPLVYTTAQITDQTISVSRKTAVVRHKFTAKILNRGVPAGLNVGVMQVWQKEAGKWKLLARQGFKLP